MAPDSDIGFVLLGPTGGPYTRIPNREFFCMEGLRRLEAEHQEQERLRLRRLAARQKRRQRKQRRGW